MVLEGIINIFSIVVFGNELWRYFAFLITLILFFPISKFLIFIVDEFLTRFAKRTNFKLDDILIKSINPPLWMFILAGFFYMGSSFIRNDFLNDIFMRIFNFLIIIPVVYFLIKFSTLLASYYLKENRTNKSKINEAAVDILMSLVQIVLVIIGILLILANLGYDVSALIAGLGVGGLAFALAAQDILKNFFAGISLIFDKTFSKKERISFNGYEGIIEELKLRSTKLRTYDGVLLTIPNSMLADNIVENVTKVPRYKVSMVIGVTYSTSSKKLKEAKKIIFNAIKKHPEADEEKTWIYFDNFNSYSLDIRIIYYAKNYSMADWPDRMYMKEDINFTIKEEFEKAGIEMAFPTQTIELKK
jgi:MscS family membrane protein